MKKEEVPHDKKIIHGEDNSLVKVLYVTNQEGAYETTRYEGWEAENLAMSQAWEDIDEKIARTLELVKKGELSPIAYYMEKNLMDLPTLSSYVGSWKFFVKKHLTPQGFKKLSPKKLEKYAAVFNISVEELVHFNG
ncbi:hypothetical protein [Flavihumibacter sp. CACIAM 22H1]|uniref:hypothetical protein n=1 Tax=Flavihumibacter sp. CACIAM 22H1 TaxID=1812911 RepID=UPI0007A872AD|nr:hypothetical protein [Flavihumibacter sp. CACIAM 22H1]KYP13976.1 MAG: hypothetical protein A1D16_16240 [Flavihumibacter sp. CACIAM 22H1]